jgi:hypothetical protein
MRQVAVNEEGLKENGCVCPVTGAFAPDVEKQTPRNYNKPLGTHSPVEKPVHVVWTAPS